ncbi:MAG: DUF2330 domain-containing protein [Polyangiales bacterium]
MSLFRTVVFSLALAAGVAQAEEAAACGGCFGPPSAAQVVTDHRMVLALSTAQTTLWDQFQYAGDPEDFSWVLPIRYTERTRVEVASDAFMSMMDAFTTPSLTWPVPPPLAPDCAPPPSAPGVFDAAAADAPAWDAGVTVLREEVVGPYAVAIVRGASGMGLRDWLRANGYAVPAAMEPVLDHYLGLDMDFVALRLRAGKGVHRMVPVRVTVDGYQPRLPLRMVAAGVADRVAISLIVVADARVEAANFPNGEIRDDELVYDWRNPTAVSGDVLNAEFAARNRAAGDRLWLTWTAEPRSFAEFESAARACELGAPGVPFADAAVPADVPGTSDAGTPRPLAIDDVRVAFGDRTAARVTRLRADLPARMLDRDLDLAASDGGWRLRAYSFGRELNRPEYSACPWPREEDGGASTSCAAAPGLSDRAAGPALLGVGLAALAAARLRRRG